MSRGELTAVAVTIKDIAAEANVAISTVSKVLNGHDASISQATRERVLATVERLGYRPNMVARGLRAKSTKTIGFVLPDITNPFFPAIARGIEDYAQTAGFTVVFCDTDDDIDRQRDSIRSLNSNMVDGMILTGALGAELVSLEDRAVPTVVVDRCWEGEFSGVGSVYCDLRAAVAIATGHLLSHGCSRVAFISVSPTLAPDRYQGYLDALEKAGVAFDPALVVEGSYSVDTGDAGVAELLSRTTFDGIVCGNDLIAIGALRARKCAGLSVPDDVRVVGLDDIYLSKYVDPALTTIHQPGYEMGRAAAQMLIEALTQGGRLRGCELPFELVVRQSA